MNDTLSPTLSDEACKTASLVHLSALIGLLGNGIGFLLGPLVVWMLKRDTDPFIDEHGKEAVNFQLTMFITAIVSAVLIVVLVGFLLLALVGIAMVVFPIIAAMKARNGEMYHYPATIRFIK